MTAPIEDPALRIEFEIGLEKHRGLGVGAEKRIFFNRVPIPIGARDGMWAYLHEGAADQYGRDDFSRDRTRRHAHGGFPRGRAAAAAIIPDSIFAVIGKVGVARPVGVLDRGVIFGALIGVLDQQRDRRSGRQLAFGFFIAKDAGKDFDKIGLLPRCRKARGAGTPPIEEDLDVSFFERDQGRAAIDDAADRNPMAFAESCHPEEMAKGIVRHRQKPKRRGRFSTGVSHRRVKPQASADCA